MVNGEAFLVVEAFFVFGDAVLSFAESEGALEGPVVWDGPLAGVLLAWVVEASV
ncbi:hypothetical protein QP110_04345 [Aerococcus sp. UMB10185]|uniref:hypothetical protein n=1 Tax=unclassified Aerococcus TaxID=2618060 RepID=UPI00254ABB3C|nr:MULTISPECIES: hypothetical protein [unclassified Aerococcus]MDK6233490.1 hypothetical protein [Aerococcus sp. UMB10185]MDK6855527.1 hypothetical protein [Aerococcus sp. UMB7533]